MSIAPIARSTLLIVVATLVSGASMVTESSERVVFDALLAGHDSIVLAAQTAQFQNPGPPPEIGGRMDPQFAAELRRFPQPLMARLDSLSRAPRPSGSLDIPRHVTIVSDSLLREIFSSGVRGGWEDFRRRYPRRDGCERLSPVAFSADSTEAMVYREVHCGGLCGDGTLYWLRRSSDGRWSVIGSLMFWVS